MATRRRPGCSCFVPAGPAIIAAEPSWLDGPDPARVWLIEGAKLACGVAETKKVVPVIEGRGPVRDRWALAAVCAVLFLTFLDTTIVSVALADVQSSLHAGVTQLQWVVNGYALTFASLMMIAGSLSDRLGRKRVMLSGLSIFGVGSLLGALAPNPWVLIAARVVMGVGAAASEPGTLSVIRHLYPDPEERARALGAWAAVSGLALALGPVIGGVLVGIGTWRAVFYFNVAAAAVVLSVASRVVPESADPQSARLDLPGFVTGAAGARCTHLRRDPWRDRGLPVASSGRTVRPRCGRPRGLHPRRAHQPGADPRPCLLPLRPLLRLPRRGLRALFRGVFHLLFHRSLPERGGGLLRVPSRRLSSSR